MDHRRRDLAFGDGESEYSNDAPAAVVREAADSLPRGRALDLATGLGRNAIFLAERGWTVDAIDITRAQLDRARERARARSVRVEWILADVDSYAFPKAAYDVVTVSYFDARERLPAVKAALAPGGVLCYEHHLEPAGAGARYRFGPGELEAACSDLDVRRYEEDLEAGVVRLVARRDV